MLNGGHTISWWCKLQSTVALSSCEAELNASLKGAVEGLNAQGLAQGFGDDMLINSVIRYLKGRPRVALQYCFQEPYPEIVVMTDSDWAGDEATRRSTSG